MLITKQLKKSIHNIRYSIDSRANTQKAVGVKLKKYKHLEDKLHKNLSQLPIGLNASKENASLANIMLPRPSSSLVASNSLSRSREKVEIQSVKKHSRGNNKKGENKRNDEGNYLSKKRLSGASHSHKKWNNLSIDEGDFKCQIAQNRKKYNLSCGDMIDEKSRSKSNKPKLINKRSFNHPSKPVNPGEKKEKIQKKNNEKSKIKFKKIGMNKSKGSTININAPKPKKKQTKDKENKMKKKNKSKSKGKIKVKVNNKMFVFSKEGSDEQREGSVDDYPINKYISMKKTKGSLNIKIGVNYNASCLNIVSGSSGILNDEQISSEMQGDRKRIYERVEFEGSDSYNIEEIKHYELHSPFKNKKQGRGRGLRREIIDELEEDYPYLNSKQLNFLASVVLIQRKWREHMLMNPRNNVVTQYFEERKSPKPNFSKENTIKTPDKNETVLSQTKIAEFQPPQIDSSLKKRTQIEVERESSESEEHLEEEQRNNLLTDRKPKTQIERVQSYQWILSREVFPEVGYLEYRISFLRESLQKNMKLMIEQRINKIISPQQFQIRKKELLASYKISLTKLKKTKHDIKKGYLKYIDCINSVKQIKGETKSDNKYGLRKVSSESDFLSTLYDKIYKFDGCVSQWSGGSQSIEILTKKILVRKQFFISQQNSRRSVSDLRMSSKSSLELMMSSRQIADSNRVIFQNTEKLPILQNLEEPQRAQSDSIITVKQFKFSNQIFPKSNILKLSDEQNERPSTFSLSLKKSQDTLIKEVESELILELTKQFQREISNISPMLIDIILINQENKSESSDNDQKSPILQSLHRQLETITSPRSHRSPVESVGNYEENIQDYLSQMINFIEEERWAHDIIYNMNNTQTFHPLAYLKFLRDFQVPEDDYMPIISNQRFIEWESSFINQTEAMNEGENELMKQSRAIFHRCIFEVFLSELQKQRPYGDRGRPFPWQEQYSVYMKQISFRHLPMIFSRCCDKLLQYSTYRCGIISQKYFIGSESDLERMHEQNEDRIIQMLEHDLKETRNNWYQTQQHCLQIKLQISYLLEELLIEQASRLLILLNQCNDI